MIMVSTSSDPTNREPCVDRGAPHSGRLQTAADVAARHYKEQFGRGPTRCRAHFAGRDGVLVILEGTLSPAERRLVALGASERARAARAVLQAAVEDDLRAAIGAAIGRPIVTSVSGLDVVSDIATELFLLGPDA
jgi:uncharacterized protein YbcI